jgi:NADH-quinone oxidoreductase subunit M
MNEFPLLTMLTLTPLLGGLMVLGVQSQNQRAARTLALLATLASLAQAALLWVKFDRTQTGLQFGELCDWIPALGVQYHLGVDGLGLPMVLLSAILVPMALLLSWKLTDRPGLYFGLLLLLESGLFGAFTALNFFHWFLFWELSLIPAFFLIKLWGGPNRGPAATQFFIYTMAGSVALLLAFLAVGLVTGTFNFIKLAEMGRSGELNGLLANTLGWKKLTGQQLSVIIFLGAFLGFAVKVPVWPFHTWQPATYAEAPTSTTLLLTGAMSKMGVYGFLRILLPIFPEPARLVLKPLLILAAATIVLSACAAFAQRDLKRMLAYSSMNHLGYCLLGMFAATRPTGFAGELGLDKVAAINGVMLQMFNHGITAGTLFCFVAFLERRSGGLRGLHDFGGLRKPAPVFAGLMGIALFASIGLPGLSGFVGEFLIFKGAFTLATWPTAISTLGLLLTAIFLLTLIQRVFAGPLNPRWEKFPDLTAQERLLVLPGLALIFLLGLWPQALVSVLNTYAIQFAGWMNF